MCEIVEKLPNDIYGEITKYIGFNPKISRLNNMLYFIQELTRTDQKHYIYYTNNLINKIVDLLYYIKEKGKQELNNYLMFRNNKHLETLKDLKMYFVSITKTIKYFIVKYHEEKRYKFSRYSIESVLKYTEKEQIEILKNYKENKEKIKIINKLNKSIKHIEKSRIDNNYNKHIYNAPYYLSIVEYKIQSIFE
jgi:hypothetical protein